MINKTSSYTIIGAFGICALVGFMFIQKLDIRLYPNTTLPSITVRYSWPGASAEVIENQITSLLESSLSRVSGVEDIRSKSNTNQGQVSISLDKFTDLDYARFEVSGYVRSIYASLPQSVSYPNITINRPEDDDSGLLMAYTIYGIPSDLGIYQYVENNLRPYLSKISGIHNVEVNGGAKQEWLISYDAALLERLSIQRSEILAALNLYFGREGLGIITQGEYSTSVVLVTEKADLSWDIPIKMVSNRLIYLRDICRINRVGKEPQRFFRVNGRNAVTIQIEAKKGVNTLQLAAKIEAEIQRLRSNLQETYSIVKSYDSTTYIASELEKLTRLGLLTISILLLFVYISTLNFRYLIVALASIFVNLGISIIGFYLLKVEIQLYSLAGITISLGLVVDNAIVMIQHQLKYQNRRVFIPLLAATFTTIGALSIIYLLDEELRIQLVAFAQVVMINLFVSLLVALFFIPEWINLFPIRASSYRYPRFVQAFKERLTRIYRAYILKVRPFRWIAFSIMIWIFGIPFFLLPTQLEPSEQSLWKSRMITLYNQTIGSDGYTNDFRPVFDKVTGGLFRLFIENTYERMAYSNHEETKIYILASPDVGVALKEFNESILEIENYLQQFTEISQFISTVTPRQARIEVRFPPQNQEGSYPYLIQARLKAKVIDMGGLSWNIFGVGKGFNNRSPKQDITNFDIQLRGYNYEELNLLTERLQASLLEEKRISDAVITSDLNEYFQAKEQYFISVDENELTLSDYSLREAIEKLKSYTLVLNSDGKYIIEGKLMDIRLIHKDASTSHTWNLAHMQMGSPQKPLVLNDKITIYTQQGDPSIVKVNQEYIKYIKLAYNGYYQIGEDIIKAKLQALRSSMKIGYVAQIDASRRLATFTSQNKQDYVAVILLVISVICLTTTILFNNFKQGLKILMMVPLSFVGIFFTFYYWVLGMDQGGMASFILCAGLTVNAAIFIMDEYNFMKKLYPHISSLNTYLRVVEQKLFPIALTLCSSILGFIPFILQGENEVFWFGLGVGTVGGLSFSFIGLILFMPLIILGKNEKS
ncbi:MAG: efflux RND transporter permease subunit [Bacteroidota bacterium]